jgi:hypothetical protein
VASAIPRAHAPLLIAGDGDEGEDEDGADDGGGAGSERERSRRAVRHRARAMQRGVTSKARQQPGETLGPGPPAPMPDKPMMELKAGSNVWYQAYVVKESQNEAKVRFPCERGGACAPLGRRGAARRGSLGGLACACAPARGRGRTYAYMLVVLARARKRMHADRLISACQFAPQPLMPTARALGRPAPAQHPLPDPASTPRRSQR